MQVIVLSYITIEHPAIVLCHIQGAMSHQLLEGERIAATIQQILTGEGMTELVDGCTVDPSAFVVPGDCVAQGILRQHTAVHITEKIIFRFTASYLHIFPEDVRHKAAQGNDLYFTVFVMPENDL